MADSRTSTHVFKVLNGLSLSIDIVKPRNTPDNGVVLLHFHGGFLVIGEKTTFTPHWLVKACHARGWTYATPSYRLLPEATGLEILSDACDAVQWLSKNISDRIVIAGSSAGGYLALAASSHIVRPRPLAVLSVYGALDFASKRYIESGQPLLGPVKDLPEALEEVNAAMNSSHVLDGYAFPQDPSTDQRFRWICALHQAARYPDVLTRIPGLAGRIATEGFSAIPEQYRPLFPASFGLKLDLPPTVLLHGNADVMVEFSQSASVAEKMEALGIKIHLECAEGQGHGFDARSDIDLDKEDTEQDDAMRNCLRRVIDALDKAVAMSSH